MLNLYIYFKLWLSRHK